MPDRSADDYTVIRREMLRNRVIELCVRAGITAPAPIPDDIFVAAGYTTEDIAALTSTEKRWPILEADLRHAG